MLGSFATCPKRQSTGALQKEREKEKKERKEGRAESVSLSCSVFFWRGLGTPSFTCKME